MQATLTTVAVMGTSVAAERALSAPADGCSVLCSLYDPRFGPARNVARALAPWASLHPVQGDVTDWVEGLLTRARGLSRFAIVGVTTDIVPFCLQQWVGFAGTSRLESQRLNTDIFTWRLAVVRRMEGDRR